MEVRRVRSSEEAPRVKVVTKLEAWNRVYKTKGVGNEKAKGRREVSKQGREKGKGKGTR